MCFKQKAAVTIACLFLTLFSLPACKSSTSPPPAANTEAASTAKAQPSETPATPETPEPIDPSLVARLSKEHWSGDIDGLRKRRYIRALVPYNKTNFFYDGPQARGITYEALKEFEKFLNAKLNTGRESVNVVFIPVTRADAVKRMRDGRGDLLAWNIPAMPELQKAVDFSDPVRERAKEVVVTGPTAPPITSLDDLSGKEVYVRKYSRYWPNLRRLNERFRAEGKPAVILKEGDSKLEDEDILDMVHAGLVEMTVMDDLIGGFWARVYDGITVHQDVSIADEDKIAWAVQKGTPQFVSLINEFLKEHKVGTSFGNTVLQRYLKDTKWAENNVAPQEMEKFKPAVASFKKYAAEYNFDWLMIAAQAYQESTIDQSKTSPVGAVGVMQIKPSTAAGDPINIVGVDKDMEKNINAGVKYLNFIVEHYFKDASMGRTDRGLFALASYNAGPNRIAKLRKQAGAEGFDPNAWFGNVELIAGREIGAETVAYVSNIYKYYVAYQIATETAAKKNSRKS